jgi:integrase/recombinase XerD
VAAGLGKRWVCGMRTSTPPGGRVGIVPRENANGARAKSGGPTVLVGAELIRPHADYLHGECASTDSDYVFINIWAEPHGQAWSYPAVYCLVLLPE